MSARIHSRNLWVGVLIAISAVRLASAANYDESTDGDLSGDRQNPTLLAISAGANSLTANTGIIEGDEIAYDQEYFRIDLPAGHQLSAIRMAEYESDDGTAFIGVQNGTIFTFDPPDARANIGSLLGYSHFGPNEGHNPGDDILPAMGAAQGAIGFTPPLPGPSYTFWIQQTGTPTDYRLDFIVTAIPEPGSTLLVVAAVGFAALLRRRSSPRQARRPAS
jgi:hypothetical protein